ncbi:MAG: hypothetical protein ACOZQL_39960 [Myxococcota bacterium]
MNNRLMPLICVALMTAGCANTTHPVYIEKLQPFTEECGAENDTDYYSPGGTLDVAAGAPQFLIVAQVKSLEGSGAPELALRTGEVLDQANRNRPQLNQAVINYRLSKRLGATPKEFVQNVNVPLSADGMAVVPVQLISPDLGTLLFDSLTPSNDFDDVVDVTVELEFTGVYSATQTPLTTGVYTYPVRAFRSAPTVTCTAPQRFVRAPLNMNGVNCSYAGQTTRPDQIAPMPSSCCTPGSAGC